MAHLIIIGGGPAGLSAAIYAARANISVSVIYQDDGALGKTDKIENYFGFAEPVTGKGLLEQGRTQASRLGVHLLQTEVIGLESDGQRYTVKTTDQTLLADAVILATGAPRVVPPIRGIRDFEGRGVSYCAICDAFFYRGKTVAVLGAGAYALGEAEVLLRVAQSVTLLTGGAPAPDTLPAGLTVDTRKVTAIEGGEVIERISFAEGESLVVDGLFIAYGTAGSADLARKLGALLDGNKIRIAENMQTNLPGLFAAGDCTGGLLQIAKAVHDGAAAGTAAAKYLRNK